MGPKSICMLTLSLSRPIQRQVGKVSCQIWYVLCTTSKSAVILCLNCSLRRPDLGLVISKIKIPSPEFSSVNHFIRFKK